MAEIKGLMELEVKAESVTESGEFSGILSTYGNIDLAGDVCEPHCFDKTVAEQGTRRPLLWQHDQAEPIGHLEITDTVRALTVDGKFNLDTQRGREAYSLLKNQDINGLSIGYTATDFRYDDDGIRHLLTVDLFEGSLVSVPCNQMARAQAKSARRLAKMSIFASCKFLSKLSAKDRDEALAELDALELKANEPDPEEKPDEDPAEEPEPEETEDEEKSKKDEESEPKEPEKEPEDEDAKEKALKDMNAKLDAILKKLEA